MQYLQIHIDRNDERGPVLDGCWGSEHARFDQDRRDEAYQAMQDLAELYPDADWVLLEMPGGTELERIESRDEEEAE